MLQKQHSYLKCCLEETMKNTNSENRKVKYTKRVIRESLYELLKIKAINKITVKELTELADINRSTFYAYYETMQDLIEEIEIENAHKIIESIHIETYPNDLFKEKALNDFLNIVCDNEEISFWFLDENVTGIGRKMVHDYTESKFSILWTQNNRINSTEAYFFFEYIYQGCIAMLIRWYNNKDKINKEKLKKIFYKIADNSLSLVH